MSNESKSTSSGFVTDQRGRRSFLAGAGAAAFAGVAGCMGSQSGGSEQTVGIASFPLDVDGVTFEYMDNEGLLTEELEGTGWDYELNLSFDDVPQFVSGSVQIGAFSELEAARIGPEQDIELAVFGRRGNADYGWLVKTGSRWDPDESGGVEETVDMMVEEGENFAIGGWGIGHVPADQIIFDQQYGYEMSEEGGDVNVVTAEVPAIPQLVEQGDVAIGTNSPTHGAASYFLNDQLKPLHWDHDVVYDLGMGFPPLAGLVTRQSFLDENEEIVEAVFNAVSRAYDWLFENGTEEVPQDSHWRELIGTQSQEEAEYAIRWDLHEEDVKYRSEYYTRPRDITMTTDRILNAQSFLGQVQDIGLIPENWDDYVNMVTL